MTEEGEGVQDGSGKGALSCRSTQPCNHQIHASIYHWQNEITDSGKEELNLNDI